MSLRRTVVVALVAGALVATAACGARLTDAQREQALATNAGGQSTGDGSVSTGDLAAPVTATASSYSVTVTGDPTGGTYTLTAAVDGGDPEATEPIPFDADAAALQTSLQALDNVGADNATVEGDGPYTVTFTGDLAGSQVELAVGEAALTGGNDPGVTVEPIEPDAGGEIAGPDPGAGGDGGTTGGEAGGGTTGGEAVGGACAPGSATGPGVTPTEIKVGNVSQISGLVPGFGQTGVNGARAYFNMVNNQGGVCGRKITLVTADDRFQAATNRSETDKLADQVLAFVGSTTVVDDGGAPVIDAKGVADVSLATTPVRVRAANNFSPNPIDPTPGVGNGIAKIFSYFMETQGVKTAALFYQDAAVGVVQAENYKIDMQKAGLELVATYPVAVTATNFRSQANDMKQKDVDLVITIAEINAIANLARALSDVGYQPDVPFYGAQSYGQKLLQVAGQAAEGTEVGLIFAIPEEAGSVPAMAEFNTWYGRTAPGADADFFALAGWVAADMFTEALRGVGPDPTQEKIIAELKTFTAYDGDGLVAPINPAQKKQASCFQVVEVKGGRWQKQFPARGFQC